MYILPWRDSVDSNVPQNNSTSPQLHSIPHSNYQLAFLTPGKLPANAFILKLYYQATSSAFIPWEPFPNYPNTKKDHIPSTSWNPSAHPSPSLPQYIYSGSASVGYSNASGSIQAVLGRGLGLEDWDCGWYIVELVCKVAKRY